MEVKPAPDLLTGMSAAQAKEYIFAVLTTLKLMEAEVCTLEEEEAKWKQRAELVRSKGTESLAASAEKEAERVIAKKTKLLAEAEYYKNEIEKIRKQLPGLAARERNIDPDLLQQELLMVLGCSEEEAAAEKTFRELEKNNNADAALEALKAKLKEGSG